MENITPETKKKKISLRVIFVYSLIIFCAAAVKPIFKQLYMNQNNYSAISQDAARELAKKFDKYEDVEELREEAVKHIKDTGISAKSVIYGFFYQTEIIREFCNDSGYVPNKYIDEINQYKKGDIESQLFQEYQAKLGNSDEAKTSFLIVKEGIFKTAKKMLQIDFDKVKTVITKAEYCKYYDDNAKSIVSERLNEMRKLIPNTYSNYF